MFNCGSDVDKLINRLKEIVVYKYMIFYSIIKNIYKYIWYML